MAGFVAFHTFKILIGQSPDRIRSRAWMSFGVRSFGVDISRGRRQSSGAHLDAIRLLTGGKSALNRHGHHRGVFWLLSFAVFLGCALSSARAEDLSIITSYPPSFYEPFQRAFEARNPDVRVTVVQRNTGSAIRFILEKPEAAAATFWA